VTLLRYIGQQPVSFMAFPYLGEVEPGEFEARESDVEALLCRRDVEPVDGESAAEPEPAAEPEAPAPAKPRKTSPSKPPEAPQPAVTDPTTTA
jgi:hypothetical protein